MSNKEKIYDLRFFSDKNKYAIYEVKSKKVISDFFDDIKFTDFSYGRSLYYLAKNKDRWAVFNKEGKQISNWYEIIPYVGLLEGRSKLYVVIENDRQAVFDVNGNFVIGWYPRISWEGFIRYNSKYSVVLLTEIKDITASLKGNTNCSLSYGIVDNKNNLLLTGFDYIYSYGLFQGNGRLFIAEKDNKIALFDINRKRYSRWLENNFVNLKHLKNYLSKK